MKKLIPVIISLALLAALAAVAFSAEDTAPPKVASTNEPTVVTSDRLQVDYAHNFGTFEGNVLAVDPRITVRADKMIVFFDSTNSGGGGTTNAVRAVQRIIAEGSVVITTPDDKRTGSERADYTAADGKVVLTGNPHVQSPDGTVTGKTITFWRNQSKMDVESDATETNRTRLIIYPEEQRKKSDEEKTKEPAPPPAGSN